MSAPLQPLGDYVVAVQEEAESKTASGLSGVRWKITVATGTEAKRWDQRQAEAIKELLEWATQHYQPPAH